MSEKFKDDRMRDAWYWAAQMSGWMNDETAGVEGTYYVEIIGGRPILVMDGDSWDEEKVKHVRDCLRGRNFPVEMKYKQIQNGNWRLFIMEPDSSRLVSNYVNNWESFEIQKDFSETEFQA